MKVDTKCFDCFKIVVEEFYDIDMKEGVHFAVHDNGVVRLIGRLKVKSDMMEFYRDAWMSSYAYYNHKEK